MVLIVEFCFCFFFFLWKQFFFFVNFVVFLSSICCSTCQEACLVKEPRGFSVSTEVVWCTMPFAPSCDTSCAPSTGVCSKQLRSHAGACSLFCVLRSGEGGGMGTSLKPTQSLCSVSSSAHSNRGNVIISLLPSYLPCLWLCHLMVMCFVNLGVLLQGLAFQVFAWSLLKHLWAFCVHQQGAPPVVHALPVELFYLLCVWLLLVSSEASDFSCWKRQSWSPSSIFIILVNL